MDKTNGRIVLTDKNSTLFSYVVMPKYGLTLQKLFKARKQHFSADSIYSLGIQILNIFE